MSNTPSTYASAAPGRTMSRRALPPSSRSRAWASRVLPAPVSPVSMLRPCARRAPELLAKAVVEGGPGHLGQGALVNDEPRLDPVPGLQRADGAAVDGD